MENTCKSVGANGNTSWHIQLRLVLFRTRDFWHMVLWWVTNLREAVHLIIDIRRCPSLEHLKALEYVSSQGMFQWTYWRRQQPSRKICHLYYLHSKHILKNWQVTLVTSSTPPLLLGMGVGAGLRNLAWGCINEAMSIKDCPTFHDDISPWKCAWRSKSIPWDPTIKSGSISCSIRCNK